MPNIIFVNEGKTIEAEIGANIRTLAKKNGVQLYQGLDILFNCQGNGLCGTCRVEVVDGKGVSPMVPIEEGSMMGWIPFFVRSVQKNHRLACRMEVKGDCQIKTHPAIEIDAVATKERRRMVLAFGFFGGIFALMMVLMALDVVNLM
jgi:ferredoxin